MADAADGGDDGNNSKQQRGDATTTPQQQSTTATPQPGGDALSLVATAAADETCEDVTKKQKLNGSEDVVSSSNKNSNKNNATGGGGAVVKEVTVTTNKNDTTSSTTPSGAVVTTTSSAPIIQTPDSTTTTTSTNNKTDNDDNSNKADTTSAASTSSLSSSSSSSPPFPVTVMYNKKPLTLHLTESNTVLDLKRMITKSTGVDPHLQKVLLKGIAKDEALLKDLGVSPAIKKILVIGSSIEDVLRVKDVPSATASDEKQSSSSSDSAGSWCSMTNHKKIIDKGLPDDAMPGILACRDQLPPFPLHGMLSSKGSKVRLTFKLELDEVWISTFERTEKVPISTIRSVTSQPITGYEHYHIMALQLGPTEASRFFIYWLPAQYVDAIKDALQQ